MPVCSTSDCDNETAKIESPNETAEINTREHPKSVMRIEHSQDGLFTGSEADFLRGVFAVVALVGFAMQVKSTFGFASVRRGKPGTEVADDAKSKAT